MNNLSLQFEPEIDEKDLLINTKMNGDELTFLPFTYAPKQVSVHFGNDFWSIDFDYFDAEKGEEKIDPSFKLIFTVGRHSGKIKEIRFPASSGSDINELINEAVTSIKQLKKEQSLKVQQRNFDLVSKIIHSNSAKISDSLVQE